MEKIPSIETFRCANCGGSNPPDADVCQYCGRWLKEPPQKPYIPPEPSDDDWHYQSPSEGFPWSVFLIIGIVLTIGLSLISPIQNAISNSTETARGITTIFPLFFVGITIIIMWRSLKNVF